MNPENNNAPVHLFFGGHDSEEDYLIALIEIDKICKKNQNTNKILILEHAGLDLSTNEKVNQLVELKYKANITALKTIFNELNENSKKTISDVNSDYYKYTITFEDGPQKKLLEYVRKKRIKLDIEQPEFKNAYDFIDVNSDKEEHRIQFNRDEVFTKQIQNIKQTNPSSIILVIRGRKHIQWLPRILFKKEIPFRYILLKENLNLLDKITVKLILRNLNKKIK